jgi:hypothetical protein
LDFIMLYAGRISRFAFSEMHYWRSHRIVESFPSSYSTLSQGPWGALGYECNPRQRLQLHGTPSVRRPIHERRQKMPAGALLCLRGADLLAQLQAFHSIKFVKIS